MDFKSHVRAEIARKNKIAREAVSPFYMIFTSNYEGSSYPLYLIVLEEKMNWHKQFLPLLKKAYREEGWRPNHVKGEIGSGNHIYVHGGQDYSLYQSWQKHKKYPCIMFKKDSYKIIKPLIK